jgi:hypothetical protein
MVKKVLLIVFGLLGMLVGAGLAIGGGLLFAVTRGDGWISSGTQPLSTDTFAFVSESQVIENGRFSGPRGNDVQLRVRAEGSGGKDVFIGVGPTGDVDRYLTGVPHELVTRVHFSPFRLDTIREGGTSTPEPPADQGFWTAKVSGSGSQTLAWSLPVSGDYRVVVMNDDASASVSLSAASVGVRVPFLHSLGLGLLIGGIVLAVVGLLLFIRGLMTRVQPAPPAGGWPPPPGYGYGPPGPYGPPGAPYGPGGYPAPPGAPPPYGAPAPEASAPGQPGWSWPPTGTPPQAEQAERAPEEPAGPPIERADAEPPPQPIRDEHDEHGERDERGDRPPPG